MLVANLAENIKNLLQRIKVTTVHGWSDSIVVLQWPKGNGTYKFVHNRTDNINSKAQIQWHYVSTDENPADIGSTRCNVDKLPKKWLEGPTWLVSGTGRYSVHKRIRKRSEALKGSFLCSKTK